MRTGEAVSLLFRLTADGSQGSREIRRLRGDYVKELRAMEVAGQRVLTVLSSPIRGRLGIAGSLGISAARQALRSFAANEIELAKKAQAGLADQTAKVEAGVGKMAARVAAAASSFKFTRAEVDLFASALARAERLTASAKDVELRGTLKRVGVNRVAGRSDPEAALGQFASAFNRIESAEDRASLAAEVFGRNVGVMLPKLEAARTSMLGLEGAAGGAARGLGGAAVATSAVVGPLVLAAAAVAAVVAAYAGLAAIGVKATAAVSKAGEEIYRASERTGIGAEKLSVYKLAANEAEISFDTFGLGITRFNQRLVEADEGNKKLGDTFRRLGVDVEEGVKHPEQAFETFIKNFAASEDGAKKTAVAIELFGESGAKMIPVLNRLGGEFDVIKQRALELGVVLNNQEAKALHDAEMSFKELKAAGAGLALTLGKETAPATTALIRIIANVFKEAQPLARFIGRLSSAVLVDLTLRVLGVVSALGTVPTAVSETIEAFKVGQTALLGYTAVAAEAGRTIFLAAQGNYAEAAVSAGLATQLAKQVSEATLERFKQSAATIEKTYNDLQARLTRKAPDTPDTADRDLGTRDADAEKNRKKAEEAARRARLLDAKTELDAKERLYEQDVAALQASFEAKRKSELDYANQRRTLSFNLAKDKLAEIETRRLVLLAEDKLEVEKTAELRALAEERKQIIAKQQQEAREIENEYYRGEIERLTTHKAAVISLLEDQSQRIIAAYQDAADRRLVTATSAALKINDIEAKSLGRRIRDAEERKELAGESLEAQRAIQDELAKLYEEESASIERQKQRIHAARREDVEREREAAEEKKRISEDLLDHAFEVGGLDIERMRRQGASRLEILRAARDHEVGILNAERRRALERLNAEKSESLKRVVGVENELKKRQEIREIYAEREALTVLEFERRKKAIEDEFKRGGEQEDPFSGRSLFGDTFADELARTGSAIAALGATAQEVFRQMGESAGNMTTLVSGAIGNMVQGMGNLVEQFVLTGLVGPNALRKIAAATLASFAAQAIVRSLYSLGEGFAYKAKASAAWASGNVVSAVLYEQASKAAFKSALTFGLIGAGAAVGGRLIAGDAFSGGGAGGGGGEAQQEGRPDASRDTFTRDSRNREGTIWERVVAALDRNSAAVGRLESIPPGEVIQRGVEQNPDAVADGFGRALDRNPQVFNENFKKLGFA